MAIFFYLFASLLVVSSLLVVASKNPVYSVLWLIFAFCNSAGLMLLIGAEFLAMMLIIVYVGAVAVLFLFVVMMLNVSLTEIKEELNKNLFISVLVSLVMLADLIAIIVLGAKGVHAKGNGIFMIPADIGNVHAIARVLYTDFILPFQTAGLILFAAMVACIALTLRYRAGVKRQDTKEQLARTKENSLFLAKPKLNSGVEGIKYE